MGQLPFSSEDIAEILDRTQWSQGMSWDEMKRMSEYFDIHRVAQGEKVFSQGSTDNSLGILLKGTLKVVREEKGKHHQLAIIKAPQTFGELSLVDGQARSAHIEANAEAQYLLITKNRLDKMAIEYPKVAYKVLWRITFILSQRLRNTSGQLAEYLTVES